jgi:hypothetical protein
MAFRRTFIRLAWSGRRNDWFMDQRTGEEAWDSVPVSSLVGRVVSLGDKNGHVYEGATVTGFDEQKGHLTLEGGRHGSPYRPDDIAPLDRPERVWAYDVARGVVHSEDDL